MNRLALALTALVLSTACSTGTNYFADRAWDLTDIIRIKGMAGEGIGAKLDVTEFLHLGGMYEQDVAAAGWANRSFDSWDENSRSWGLLYGHEEVKTMGVPMYAGSYGWHGEDFVFSNDDAKLINAMDIRGQVMLGLGLDLQLRSGQAVDFIAGIFMLDPAHDDK